MCIEYDFDKVVLLPKELRDLRKTKHRHIKASSIFCVRKLYNAGLIDYDLDDKQDPLGCQIPLDTVFISDKGLRYLIWLRRQRRKSILLPITLSVITTVVLYTLEHLLLPLLLP